MTIETKYNIGDTVWFLTDSIKAMSGSVEGLEAHSFKGGQMVYCDVKTNNGSHSLMEECSLYSREIDALKALAQYHERKARDFRDKIGIVQQA